MTPEENRKREQDEHVKFIKEHLCNAGGDKSYVFISYKSDDWYVVLHDIVYTLVKDYGLNVYFDGDFETHNSLWIDQFPENMRSYKCKGVLVFLDDKYATSYATLLELMYSQTQKANKKVVPINLSKLTKIDGQEGEIDTGLGTEKYADGTKNVNAKPELERFNKAFNELIRRKILVDAQDWYEDGDKLTKESCSEIVAELIASCRVNENYYEAGKSLDGIVESIKDACGEDVFSKHDMVSHPIPTGSNKGEGGTEPLTKTEAGASAGNNDDTGDSESTVQAVGQSAKADANGNMPLLKYWEGFCEYVDRNGIDPAMKVSKPADRNWHAIRLGSAIIRIECTVSFRKDQLRTAYYVQDAPGVFAKAEQARETIDQTLKSLGSCVWDGLSRAANVSVYTSLTDKSTEEQYAWFCKTAEVMDKTIRPVLEL